MKIPLLILFFVFALGPGVLRADELESLLKKSTSEYDACKKFSKELKDSSQVDETGEHFKDKTTALKVLSLLEANQATPETTKKVQSYVAKKGETVTEDDIDALWSQKCGAVVSYYSNLRRLILNIHKMDFSTQEQARVVAETLKHVKEEASVPTTLISTFISMALVRLLIEQKLVTVGAEISESLATLEQKGKDLRDESKKYYQSAPQSASKAQTFKELPTDYRARLLKELKREMVGTEMIRQDLNDLLSKIRT